MAKPGRPGVTYEEVAQVADALRAQGQKTTCAAVLHALGRGSNSTVHPLWSRWNELNPVGAAPAAQVPNTLLKGMQEELDRVAAAARADIQERLLDEQANSKRLAEEGQALEAERNALQDQTVTLQAERDQAVTLAAERAAEIARLNDALAQSQAAAETARIEVAKGRLAAEGNATKVQEQAEMIRGLNEEVAQLRKELAAAQAEQRAAEKSLIEATAKMEAAKEARLEAQGREQEAKAAAKEAERKLADVEKTLIAESSRATAADATKAIFEKQVADLQTKLDHAENRVTKALETYQVLATALPAKASAEDLLLQPQQVPPTPRKRSGTQQHDRQS